MAYDPGVLHVALAAAVGDDPHLIAELRGAFLSSADALVEQLQRAKNQPEWCMASLRLQGLAASFGAVALMKLAEEAASGSSGDPDVFERIRGAIAEFDA